MKLYTVKEVAEQLQLKEKSIRNMIYEGKIIPTKIEGIRVVRVSQDEIDRLLGKVDK
jgi:excisionase family DNA binding protein